MRIHYDCSLFRLISAGIVTVLMNAITMKITRYLSPSLWNDVYTLYTNNKSVEQKWKEKHPIDTGLA